MDNFKSKKRETIKIELEIYKENWSEAYSYYLFISKLLKNNQKVPARVIKKFLTFHKSTEDLEKMELEKYVKTLTDETLNYFKGTDYDFVLKKKISQRKFYSLPDWETDKNLDEMITIECSLPDLLNTVYSSILQNRVALKSEEDTIKYVYNKIYSYIPDKRNKKSLTEYKMFIITGIIVSKLGKLWSEDEFTTSDKAGTYKKWLHGKVRYYIKQQEKLRQQRIK